MSPKPGRCSEPDEVGGLNQGHDFAETLGLDAEGWGVEEYLSRRYPRASVGEWQRRTQQGQVFLEGEVGEPGQKLRAGQRLVWRRPPWREPTVPLGYAVLYRDADVLAVAKPGGLPTLPGGGMFLQHTLLYQVRRHDPEAAPVHRLGRGTSGVVLFGRTSMARAELSRAMREGQVKKEYRALAQGILKEDAGEIKNPIGPVPHRLLGTVHGATREGKRACTRYRVLERRSASTLLGLELLTGRPHQIRIHLAALGHPLQGDPLYDIGGLPFEDTDSVPGDLGYHLHAERLSFQHPVESRSVLVECMPPRLLRMALADHGENLPAIDSERVT